LTQVLPCTHTHLRSRLRDSTRADQMVLVEELESEDETCDQVPPMESEKKETEKENSTLQKGFLDKAKEKPLYPEGSKEGYVSPETHKKHAEVKMNDDMNKGMNRGATDNNGYERPEWYTKEWPKDCQYNSPGCVLEEMKTSTHKSETHKSIVRDNERWEEQFVAGVKAMRFGFLGVTDEDLPKIIEHLKGNEDVLELDLTNNKIMDAGIQSLVAALAAGAAPNLKELRIYKNEFGDLGKTMLTQGLRVFRKTLDIRPDEPDWAKLAKPYAEPPPAVGAMD